MTLTQYIVAVKFIHPERVEYFACQAEDEQHALEQAADAYPGYNEVVVSGPRRNDLMTTFPEHETAKLIRAYAKKALDASGAITYDDMCLYWTITETDATSAEACCHLGRAMICLEEGLADPPYRLGGEMCDPEKTEIARRLGMMPAAPKE